MHIFDAVRFAEAVLVLVTQIGELRRRDQHRRNFRQRSLVPNADLHLSLCHTNLQLATCNYRFIRQSILPCGILSKIPQHSRPFGSCIVRPQSPVNKYIQSRNSSLPAVSARQSTSSLGSNSNREVARPDAIKLRTDTSAPLPRRLRPNRMTHSFS